MHLISVVLILRAVFVVTLVLQTPQPCFRTICWVEPGREHCSVLCTDGLITELFVCASILVAQNECLLKRIDMVISAAVTYPNETLPANIGNRANIRPTTLVIDLDQVRVMAEHVFADRKTFADVTTLTLNNVNASGMGPSTLVGLNALKILHIQNPQLVELPDLLDGVAATLMHFTLSMSSFYLDSYSLTHIFNGKKNLVSIQLISISLNLRTSIKRNVFRTVSAVRALILARCRIELIESNAFDNLRNLDLLDLTGNWLKTLPTGIFAYQLPSKTLSIVLSNNPWECECHLAELQKNMRSYANNFEGNTTCETPSRFKFKSVESTAFCGPIESNSTLDELHEYLYCATATNVIWIPRREVQFYIRSANGNSMFYIVDADHQHDKRIVLFTMASNQLHFLNYRCGCDQNHPIHLEHWRHMISHLICVQGMSTRRTMVQNCIAYFPIVRMAKDPDSNGWIMRSDRPAAVAIVIAVVTSCLAIGCLLSLLLGNPKPVIVEQQPEEVISRGQPHHRLSQISETTTTLYEDLDTFNGPRQGGDCAPHKIENHYTEIKSTPIYNAIY